ncbi:hypothetical protein J2Z19_003712 [Ensifer adhaerens]|uniref:Uncharacterized protein n=1 Tax=Ensifer adhaerens TaxID=106592 RepID=A0ACC5SYU1_ENSAD|nr:aminoglycoside phosphotransferase family protein [Ensifer adhaerens]MBP1873993.1 hypothetical protein [Ensifer adhaerens]
MSQDLDAAATTLSGGNVNAGVVRIGDTVRRRTGPQSASIHRLLLHLEAEGFGASPRFLGIDGQGREILAFLYGQADCAPELWQDEQSLIAAARLLRDYHDATVDFVHTASDRWAFRYPDSARHEVICHNDFAPYNLIFRDGSPAAVIDFDLAGPGPRLRDVAYLAYWTVPLSFHSSEMVAAAFDDLRTGSARLRLFCDSYGIACDAALPAMVETVLEHMGDEAAMVSMLGADVAERLARDGHLEHWRQERAAFLIHRHQLLSNLA